MIDINRDGDGSIFEYYFNNIICDVKTFYKNLSNDIIIEFNKTNSVELKQYEHNVLGNIDSSYEVVLNDNIYDRVFIFYNDDDDDRYECGCCKCCGCSCHNDEWLDD